jgi:hypothetical protein
VGEDLTIFGEGSLTFQEFVAREPLPLATVHTAVLEFLRGRDDAVLLGAHAVNAYAAEPRMTQDVDIASTRAAELAEELRDYLNRRFHIAVRVREVRDGVGYRLYQVQKPRNRHLVDVRPVAELPPAQRLADVLTVTPLELIAGKVMALHGRRGKPKAGTDWRDLALLLLTFAALKSDPVAVRERLLAAGADAEVLRTWDEVVAQEFIEGDPDDEFS